MPGYRDIKGRFPQSASGFALVLILWVVALLSILVLQFAGDMRLETRVCKNHLDDARAYYLARAGCELSLAKLLSRLRFESQQQATEETQATFDMWDIQGNWNTFQLGGGTVAVRIVPESGKIDVNYAPPELLRQAVRNSGLDEETVNTITDSILDWKDSGNLHRTSGANDEYYLSLPQPYRAKHAMLDSVEELLLVRGVTEEILFGQEGDCAWNQAAGPAGTVARPQGSLPEEQGKLRYGLAQVFTVYNIRNRGQVNINYAPLSVLMSLEGVTPEQAQRIVAQRQLREFRGSGDLAPLGMQHIFERNQRTLAFGKGSDNTFTIDVHAWYDKKGVCRKIRFVANVNLTDKKNPATVLKWTDFVG
ncbi:MAG: general secretion pathway protein GspK [Deltaproteobacteria bacterium]|nr:general secretion pathway protein GspK [Deltaproteobacteria bacterium]